MPQSKKELDYLNVLQALREIPFNVGKNLLIDFLQGKKENESINRNRLDRLASFGSLLYSESELKAMIDNLVLNNMIQYASCSGNKFWKVLALTDAGRHELSDPQLYKRKLSFNFKAKATVITEEDRKLMEAFSFFLSEYNTEQQKAIVDSHSQILCIAGAGSGKTTVLTKRIEFLIRYRGVDPHRILAITFTRKARSEMQSRLQGIDTHIETFNSFCEKTLLRHSDMAYGRQVRVITYGDKLRIIRLALEHLNTNMERVLYTYFSASQRRSKTDEQLANIFINDCFFVRDYCKTKNKPIDDFPVSDPKVEASAKIVYGVCKFIDGYMRKHGLRDYTDQLIDAISLFKENADLIPGYDHILVDEYQDVNSTQIELLELLCPKNIFCVGDPRQSIYGWRGSDVRYILQFEERYPQCEIITLTKNYRSTAHIVGLINKSIERMKMPDLESASHGDKDIRLLNFDSEQTEFEFVLQRIYAADVSRREIFVLARTNRQLNDLALLFKQRGIAHIIRSDEHRRPTDAQANEDAVTLATIHGIKGLEAEMVFVIGCTNVNFPCKASEHPVMEIFKVDEYDKEEEERRLLYVAMSRAKRSLYLSYSGKGLSSFIDEPLKNMIDETNGSTLAKPASKQTRQSKNGASAQVDIFAGLREWRRELAATHGVAPFMILHDRTLQDIASNMPMQISDLDDIYGLGPTKIRKYGKEILRIVNGY